MEAYTPLTAIRFTGLHFIIVAAKYIRALQVCRESVDQLSDLITLV